MKQIKYIITFNFKKIVMGKKREIERQNDRQRNTQRDKERERVRTLSKRKNFFCFLKPNKKIIKNIIIKMCRKRFI